CLASATALYWYRESSKARGEGWELPLIVLLFFVLPAVAVSVTRMLLWRAVKRMVGWGQTELQS
ncbi:MAG: hypothetical protein FWD53_11315, partial [Phycisphaerales bacterium]|nr:hypothetical protein [Phycisphaerales bacterium]